VPVLGDIDRVVIANEITPQHGRISSKRAHDQSQRDKPRMRPPRGSISWRGGCGCRLPPRRSLSRPLAHLLLHGIASWYHKRTPLHADLNGFRFCLNIPVPRVQSERGHLNRCAQGGPQFSGPSNSCWVSRQPSAEPCTDWSGEVTAWRRKYGTFNYQERSNNPAPCSWSRIATSPHGRGSLAHYNPPHW
jgi:hypothetical protein